MKKLRKKERVLIILDILEKLYPDLYIPLNYRNNFTFLVAVVLSAQATDKSVNKISPKLFDLADSPEKMNSLSYEKVYDLIKSIGLSRTKAKYIKTLSRQIIENFKSEVPDNFEDLESLSGVGHKTASVIMSQVFNYPAFPVDTHIHRLAKRWGLSSGKNVVQTEKDLKRLFPKDKWNSLHLRMIYFGREHCKAVGHSIFDCPICSKFI